MTDLTLRFRARLSPLCGSSNSPTAVRATGIAPSRRVWRTVLDKFRARTFFPESAARDATLSPGLPHHRRHPLTADEALAGIVLALGALGAVIYLLARWV